MKKIFLTFVLCVATFVSLAQLRMLSPDQSIIDRAVSPALVGVTRSYVLQDKSTGQTYKMDGKNHFGRVSSRAVRVSGGLIVTKEAVAPWETDEDFKEYSEGYDGVATEMMIDGESKPLQFDTAGINCISEQGTGLYFIPLDSTFEGLRYERPDGDVEGWVVLLVQSNDTSFITISFRKKLTVKTKDSYYEIERPLGELNIVGGVYVAPEYQAVGGVLFRLCGFVIDSEDKLGIVVPTVKKGSFVHTKVLPKKGARKSGGLVPVETPTREKTGSKTEAKKRE